MQKNVLLGIVGLAAFYLLNSTALASNHPATVSQGAGSVATQLHYPAKDKAAGKQGVVKFFCQVAPDGKPSHISTLNGKDQGRFGSAVEYALYHGRFNPATVDGKPTTVLIGGTVLFLISNGQPTIAITLATTESDKVATMANYVQPQMIDSDALFRRKLYALRDKYTLQNGGHPAAMVAVHVDSAGKVISKKIESESPPNGGRGRILLDVADEERFIPAMSNGKPVAGDYEMVVDFEHMRNPDSGPRLGTLIKDQQDE